MVLRPPVFVCGPLASPPLLAQIVGTEALEGLRPAVAPGRILACDPEAPYALPDLAPGQGEITGLLVLDPVAQERLWFVARALRARGTVGIEVMQDGQSVAAQTWRGHPGSAGWGSAVWEAADHGEVMQLAVAEILSRRNGRPAGDLAGMLPMVLSRAAARQAARQGVPADLRSATSSDAVEILACETLHAGFFLTKACRLRHPRFDGRPSAEVRREVFVASDAALVLPYDPHRDRVLLVEQFRMGPYGRGDPRPWMLEPVAGRIDAGETPEAAARRECLEEAGLTLRALEKISTHYCTPGYSTEVFHLYMGLCDLPDAKTGQGGLDSEQEDIRSHVISFERAMALLESGEANNGPLVLSLIWLQRERARLRASG